MMYESIPSTEPSKTNENYSITMDPVDPGPSVVNKEKIHSDIAKGFGISLAFGVVGGLILGPVAGLVLAGGALYTSTREDKYGESVRSCGNTVCNLFDKSIETCRKYKVEEIIPPEQRKQVSETLSAASDHAIKKLQDFDAKFGVTSRASKFMGLKPYETATLPIANTTDSNNISNMTSPLHQTNTVVTSYILEDENESKV